MAPRAWSKKEVAELKKLVNEEYSATEIAELHSRKATRNSIIGMCHRLGLTLNRSPNKKKTPVKPRVSGGTHGQAIRNNIIKTQLRVAYTAPVLEEVVPTEGVSLMELTDCHCKWPIGGGMYCGKPQDTTTKMPYCSVHHREALQPPQPRRRPMIMPQLKGGSGLSLRR